MKASLYLCLWRVGTVITQIEEPKRVICYQIPFPMYILFCTFSVFKIYLKYFSLVPSHILVYIYAGGFFRVGIIQ